MADTLDFIFFFWQPGFIHATHEFTTKGQRQRQTKLSSGYLSSFFFPDFCRFSFLDVLTVIKACECVHSYS
jgi:hypothetical protein